MHRQGKKLVLFRRTLKRIPLRGFVVSVYRSWQNVQAITQPIRTILVFSLLLLPLFFLTRGGIGVPHAYAATSDNLNFQARLETAAGAIAPDGYYNIEFKLYDALSGGTLLWTETYYDSNGVSAGNDNRVRVANGYVTVNLGSQTAFPGTMPWDQQLYLTMNVGGTTQTATPTWDGEMSPRLKLTAVPYAFNAKTASQLLTTSGALNSTLSIQAPTGGNQIFQVADQGAAGTYTLLTGTAANGMYIQLQGTSPGTAQTGNFNINGTGIAGTLQAQNIDTASSGVLSVGATNATNIQIGSNTTDATAKLFILDSYNSGTDPTGYNGAMYYNTNLNKMRCYINGAWVDCDTTGGGGSGVDTIGALDGGTANANGATISSTTLYLQSASGTYAGLVNTTAQTFAGDKTFSGNIIVSANKSITITGGNTASRPASPTEGMVYYDTTTKQLLTYANGKWQADRTEAVLVAANNSSDADKAAADYVATGTGDQSTIQNAIDAADPAAGTRKTGKVYLFAGTYTTSDVINIKNNVTLAGSGRGTLIQFSNIAGQTKNMISNSDTTTGEGVTIRDLRLDGNKTTNTTGTMHGIYMNNVGNGTGAAARQGATITNVWVNSFISTGIFLQSSSNSAVLGNHSQGNGLDGINIDSSNRVNVSNNVIISNTAWGIHVSGALAIVVNGNNVANNGALAGSASSGGIVFDGTSQNNAITNNAFRDNGTGTGASNATIYFSNASNNTVTGNVIADATGTTGSAITIFDAASTGNYFANNAINGTFSSTITDNGTRTVWGGQLTGNNGTGAYLIQNAGGVNVASSATATASTNSSNISITTGNATGTTSNSGSITLDVGTATGTKGTISIGTTNATTISIGNAGSTTTIQGNTGVTLSATTGTTMVCRNGSGYLSSCDATYLTPTTTNFIQNQNASQQTSSNFWLSGTGRADTSVLTPLVDTATAVALNIGTTNATQINLNKNVSIAANQNIAFAAGTGSFDQSASSGTFKTGTGAVSLNGDTTVATGKNLTVTSGSTALNGQTTIAASIAGPLLTVNQSGAGNILNLQNAGTNVLSVTSTGATSIVTTTASNSEFSIRTGGTYLFNFDSTNRITVDNGTITPDNLLENPGFESDASAGFSGWSLVAASTIETANPYKGTRNLAIIPDGTTIGVPDTKYYMAVPGETFYVEGWTKIASGTNGSASIAITYYNASNTVLSNTLISANNTTTYAKVSGTGTAPANTAYIRVRPLIDNSSTTGTWYFDDLYFAKVSQPQPLSIRPTTNATNVLEVQNAAGTQIFAVNTTSGTATIQGNTILTSATGIQLQASTPGTAQTGHFNISGTGIASTFNASTSVLTPLVDTATATALNIGTTNATSINLNQDTVLAAGQSITITGGNTASRPASPTEGMVYYDTTTKQLLTYANGKWQADRSEAVLVAASDSSDADKAAADYLGDGDTAAAGDGDQVEINQALTAGSGKKVVLLAGTYTIDAAISVPNNTTLAGVGTGTLITIPNSFNTHINAITNTTTGGNGTGITIRDLKLDGNKANQTSGTMYGVYFNGVGSGTGSSAVQGGTITNVKANNWRNDGIYLISSSNNTLTGNTAQGNTNGIYLISSSNNTLTGNTAQGNNYGIYLASSSNNTITGNTTQGNGGSGIYLISSSNNTLTGNTTQGNGGSGIYLNSSSNNTITGNTTQGNTYGISLISSSNNNTVSGNTAQGNGGSGIYLFSSSNNTVTGNTAQGNTTYGISLSSSSSNNTVSGNKIHDNGGATANNGMYINASDSNTITGNSITDTSCTTTCYAINIANSTSDTNYLADNNFSTTAGTATINDAGTGTIYAGQSMTQGGLDIRFRQANSTTAFNIQNANGISVLNVDTTNGELELGSYNGGTNPVAGKIVLATTANANTVTIQSATQTGNYTLTVPALTANANICTDLGNCSGVNGYIVNQNTAQQATSNFWLSGTGRADTSILTPLLDTPSGTTTLNIGTTNATAGISIKQDVIFAANKGIEIPWASGGNVDAIHVGISSTDLFTVDNSSNARVTIGSVSGCQGAYGFGQGKFCLNGSVTSTATYNMQNTTLAMQSTGAGAKIAGNVVNIADTLNTNANDDYGFIVDSTDSTNGNANVYAFTAKVDNGQPGNFLTFQAASNTVFTLSNGGVMTLSGTQLIKSTGTSVFEIQNAGGTATIFSADTTNSRVQVGSVTADSTGVILILDTKNTSGDPTGVNGAMYYNSNSQSFRCYQNGGWRSCINGPVYANTSAGTAVSNTTTETNLLSGYTIAANDCVPGRTYRVTAKGIYGTAGTAPTLNIKLKLGTTVLATTGATTTKASTTNRQWMLSADVICITTGASGSVEAAGSFVYTTAANAAASSDVHWEMANTATVTVDTTTAQALTISAQWGTANASNTITVRQLIIESSGP